ncbi:MAG: LacI family transcriptional regulator [Thermotogaceae bacterium]|jgi:LacI family transcriptional regulator|nr:LacI family transcriptional regulator [Thermotogaceae bacterium]
MKKPTIKDVAKKANLGMGTISRVLNNTGYVSKKTRKRVMKAIEELNYSPDPTARGLVSGTTNMISIVVPMVRTEFYDRMLNAIDEIVSEKSYDTVIFPLLSKKRLERFSDSNAFLYRTDGIVMASMPVHKLFKDGIIPTDRNVVLVDMYSERYDCAYVENVDIGEEAAEVLLKHTDNLKVLTFIEPNNIFTTNVFSKRLNGFINKVKDSGISFNEDEVYHTEINLHSAFNNSIKILKQTKDFPVGIFTTCDLFGYGLTVAAKNLNLEVGKDVFIIGVDDQIWSKDIGLTTLKQPVEEMSQFAAEILLNKINKTEGYQEIVRKKFESVLIKRDSA